MIANHKSIELGRLAKEFLHKWWVFFLFTVFFSATAYLITINLITPIYRASSTLFVGREAGATSELSIADINLGQRLTSEIRNLVMTNLTLQEVFIRLPEEHRGINVFPNLNVIVIPDTRFMIITFDDPNPETAMLVVNNLSEILIEKSKEIIGVNTLMVIDHAHMPARPISPRLFNNMIIAGLLGMIIAALAIAFWVVYSDTVQSHEEIERELGLAVLGNIPRSKKHTDKAIFRNLITASKRDSFIAESYRMFRANISYLNAENDVKVIVFTSTLPNEGKTTSIANTVSSMVALGKRVLLIDCDLRNGGINKMFSLNRSPGLTDILVDNMDFTKALNKQVVKSQNFDVLTIGKSSPWSSELLSGITFNNLIKEARMLYDYVFIDTPPLLSVSDAAVVCKISDGVVLVSAVSQTHKKDLIQSIRILNQTGSRILGLLLLKTNINRQIHHAYHGKR